MKIKKNLFRTCWAIIILDLATINCFSQSSISFYYTGATQTWVVPAGICSIKIKAWGAGGGGGGSDCNWDGTVLYPGGGGGYAEKNIPVNTGDILTICVGGGGIGGIYILDGPAGPGGWGYGVGGDGGSAGSYAGHGGAGGGGSAVLLNSNLIVVAGGGGGGGGSGFFTPPGCVIVQQGYGGPGGAGGTNGSNSGSGQLGGTAGASSNINGIIGDSQSSQAPGGGGGGGGYNGGGGGMCTGNCDCGAGGGGGGNNYVSGIGTIMNGSGTVSGNAGDPDKPAGLSEGGLGSDGWSRADTGGHGFVKIFYYLSPSISASFTQATCGSNDGTASVSASGGTPSYTYLWNNGQTTSTATGLSAGNYTTTVTDATGCSSTQILTVTSNGSLSATASSTQAGCSVNDGTASVTASNGTTPYTYTWNNGQTSQTATGLAPGNYMITVSDASGCITTQTVSVAAGAIIAIAGPASTICAGQNLVLSATGGSNYLWSNGGTTTAIIVSPTTNTSYSVIVSNGGCADTALVNIMVSPSLVANSSNTTICSGQSTTLSASGGNTFSWSNGQTTSSITVNPTTTTTYSVIVYTGACTDTATPAVIVNPLPAISSGNNVTVCTGSAVSLSASGGASYSWSTGQTASAITINPTAAATYTVIGTNANGCTASSMVSVYISNSIIANAGIDQTICQGQAASLNATGGSSYSWTPSSGLNNSNTPNPVASPSSTTTYSVIVSSGNCSPDTDVITVAVNPNPTAGISPNITITSGSSATLTVSGGATYSWTTGATSNAIIVSPLLTTTYCATAYNGNCEDYACTIIYVEPTDCSPTKTGVLYLPNAFSPNDDNENDMLKIFFGNLSCIKTYQLVIYNRWGEKVYETTDPAAGWNGTYGGKTEDAGIFTYYMRATLITGEGIIKKGNISLIQ